VPPSRLSMTCVDDQAGSPRYDDAPTRSGSSTQASLANQACSVWQIRQRVRPKNTGLRRKLSRSVLMPVGIACPVSGHLTITIPMSPSLAIGRHCICRKAPAGWSAPYVGAVLGGHRAPCLTEHGGSGGFNARGLFQPAGSLLKRSLDVIERRSSSRLGGEPW